MFSAKKFRRTMMSFFLVLGLVLACACKKEQPESASSAFSPYYSTTNSILSIPNVSDAGFSKDGVFLQTFLESEEFREAYHQQCIPTVENGGEGLPYLPLDENGNELSPENHLLVLDEKGEIKDTYDLNEECVPSADSRKMYCKGDECWLLTSRGQAFSWETEYSIDCFNYKNGLTKHIDPDFGSYAGRIHTILVSDDGYIYLSGGNGEIIVLDPDGKVKEQISLPDSYEDGKVALWNEKLTCEGVGNAGSKVLFELDEKSKEWKETSIPVMENWHRLVARKGELYSIGMSEIVRLGEQKETTLKLEEASVWGNVQDIRDKGNGEFELLVRPMSEEMIILYHLKPSDKKTYENKKEFVIAGYNLLESPLPQLVEKLSLLYPEVKFVMRDYMEELAPEGEERPTDNEIYRIMSLDIANGNAPDMYFDYENYLGLGEMGRLGYLKDLSPYLNELDQEDYFMEKITLGRKVPYCVCLSFSILGFEASPRYVENPQTWTYEDFYKSAEKFTDLTCIQSVYSKQTLLRHGILAKMDEFTQDGKDGFASEDFLKLLKWANDIGRESDWDDYKDPALDAGLFMLGWTNISSPGSVIDIRDHVLVGFPNENGSLHTVPYNLLAVSVTTSQADLAGEIIRYSLSEDFQLNCRGLVLGTMAVNRKAWEKDFEETYQFYENDPQYQDHSKEEYHEMSLAAISRADHYLYGPKSVVDIVLEEASAYFSGNCSAEHAAELIQNRVEIYLQETSS